MITNYKKYIDELKQIEKERNKLRYKDLELINQESQLQYELLMKAHDYIESEFAQKLKPLTYQNTLYYMFNDEVGIKLNKVTKYTHSIDCRVIYYKLEYRRNNIKIGKKIFSWSYKDDNLEQFVDHVIEELNKINETREKSKLSRVAKKYNL